MTDDPFADLGETLEEAPDDGEETEQGAGGSTEAASAVEETDEADEETVEELDPREETAFSYEDAQQRPFYARENTIEDFDSWLNYELERELNARGYQNIVVRELTDALLRTVVEEDLIDDVAERFESARDGAISE